MAMLDRAWLPTLAVEHSFGWKFANGPARSQAGSAPVRFPKLIDAEMVWTGAKFQNQPEMYQVELKEQHVKELEHAAAKVEGKQVDLLEASLTKAN
jgi:hypothetical protein